MLTTGRGRIGKLETMPPKPQRRPPTQIYGSRQPRRPHYLATLMARHNVTRAELIEAIEVDKGLVSKWLDEEKPTTPGPQYVRKLGRFFAVSDDPDDFVDIFADPDTSRLSRFLQGRSPDEIDRIMATLETAFPKKRVG